MKLILTRINTGNILKFSSALFLTYSLSITPLDYREKDFLYKEIVLVHNKQVKSCYLSHVSDAPNHSEAGIPELTSLFGNFL